MKGYKDSTKTQYTTGSGPGPKGAAKVHKVMREWKAGTLHSGSDKGPVVANRKQAVAIALSEAKRHPMKMAEGGKVDRYGYGPNSTGDENNNGRMKVRPRGPLIGN